MKEKLIKKIEDIVDNTDTKVIDKFFLAMIMVLILSTAYLFISSLEIFNSGIIPVHSKFLYAFNILSTVSLFYITLLGDKTFKPVNRPRIFGALTILLCFNTYCYLAEVFNYTFTIIIDKLLAVTEVPTFLIYTNVRVITVFFPILIVIAIFSIALQIPFIKEYRSELLEYTVNILTRNVYKIKPTTVDIKLCKDIETGNDIVVPEKVTFKHKLIDGSSGSGKTALCIRPDLSQIFYKKALFREELKRLTFEALNEGLCFLRYPVTNKYINENFSMDLIKIKEDRRDEFLEKFDDFILGIRDNSRTLYNKKINFNNSNEIRIEIPLHRKTDSDLNVKIDVFIKDMISETIEIKLGDEVYSKDTDTYRLSVNISEYTKVTKSNENGDIEKVECIEKEIDGDIYSEYISINIKGISDSYVFNSFKFDIVQKGQGKIIFNDVGVTVIAPDGGLAKDTLEIAEENGVKVHLIDPIMDAIEQGRISKFNPLLVGSPEKAGDIISSILVAMEQTSAKDKGGNPYFTNASIRAIRNVIILLKVMYPRLNNGDNPVLTDALDILNNFDTVVPYVKEMKKDNKLKVRWKTVIDYFETSFFAPVLDEKGKPITSGKDSHLGRNRAKTQEAISGLVNQLDNFLGREEIRYIMCDRKEGLNLSEVLERGECIAVSTRQSELGEVLGKAFALMIMLSLQNSILGRYSEDEEIEIPYHLFIDEFPFYVNDQTKVFFTFARKYNCAVTVAIQNLAQLEEVDAIFRQIVFTNTATKIVLPGAIVEDREYFSKYFGIKETFETMTSVVSNPVITERPNYSESTRGSLVETAVVSEEELSKLKFKRCYYYTTDSKGNIKVGKGDMDFLKLTPSNTIKIKEFNFEQFGSLEESIKTSSTKHKNNVISESIQENFEEILPSSLEKDDDEFFDFDNIDEIESFLEESIEAFDSNIDKEHESEKTNTSSDKIIEDNLVGDDAIINNISESTSSNKTNNLFQENEVKGDDLINLDAFECNDICSNVVQENKTKEQELQIDDAVDEFSFELDDTIDLNELKTIGLVDESK